MKKNKKKSCLNKEFIDEVSRFSSFKEFKIGDRVVYQRVSDKKTSVGDIKWFCNSSEGMCISVIDIKLGNFQLGLCKNIEKDASLDRIAKIIKSKRSK